SVLLVFIVALSRFGAAFVLLDCIQQRITMEAATVAGVNGEIVVTLDDIERLGNSNMTANARSHCNTGADQEQTLKENKMAYLRLCLRPRVLRGLGQRQMEVTLLGDQKLSMPVGISPSALQKLAHPDGEVATARGNSRAARTLMILSLYSSTSMEDVKKGVGEGLLWIQMQLSRDRALTRDLVRRAEAAGYRALVLTVDMPVYGMRIDRVKKSYSPPEDIRFANFKKIAEDEVGNGKMVLPVNDPLINAAQTWDDVTWLKSITSLPVVVKGVTTAEDAEIAIDRGVSAILVSNHGGRQLDGLPATVEVLPEIVSAVRGRVEVYVDGGVRRGTDVVKALALGAKAVFVGRPALWGLAYNVR
ncbi:unnamed protein product, partial [Ixodes persulcatus]